MWSISWLCVTYVVSLKIKLTMWFTCRKICLVSQGMCPTKLTHIGGPIERRHVVPS
ncbi:hypothetical protein GCM10010252_78370 [Streptomyces aureoverticillatus]|nr:hypothetical protein GCM10010252_78370 [Streptomyces aureoverticillatus]